MASKPVWGSPELDGDPIPKFSAPQESGVTALKESIRIKDQMIEALRRESLPEIQKELRAWQSATFPDATPHSVYKHMEKEFAELGESFDSSEAADVLILLCNLAWKCGYDLLAVTRAKMDENRTRKWGKPDKDGVVEHVR